MSKTCRRDIIELGFFGGSFYWKSLKVLFYKSKKECLKRMLYCSDRLDKSNSLSASISSQAWMRRKRKRLGQVRKISYSPGVAPSVSSTIYICPQLEHRVCQRLSFQPPWTPPPFGEWTQLARVAFSGFFWKFHLFWNCAWHCLPTWGTLPFCFNFRNQLGVQQLKTAQSSYLKSHLS